MPDAPKLSTRGASSNKVKKPSKETPRTVHKSKKKLVHSSAPASSKLETVSEDGGGSSESAPSPSAIADLSAALEAADADSHQKEVRLLERLNALIGPLTEAARAEREHEHAERTLLAARGALSGSSSSSLFAQLAGRGALVSGGTAATLAQELALTKLSEAHLRLQLQAAHKAMDELYAHDAALRGRLGRAREKIPKEIMGAELSAILGEAAAPLPPPSLLQASKSLGVTSTIIKWNEEGAETLRRKEMRGEGLTAEPTGGGVVTEAKADAVFGKAWRARLKATGTWQRTIAAAKKRRAAEEQLESQQGVVDAELNFELARVNSPPRVIRLCSKGKAARTLWAKVAALALPGRWSPRPDDKADPSLSHVGTPAGDGFPVLSDPFGLLEEAEEDDDVEDSEEQEDEYGRALVEDGTAWWPTADDDDSEGELFSEVQALGPGCE